MKTVFLKTNLGTVVNVCSNLNSRNRAWGTSTENAFWSNKIALSTVCEGCVVHALTDTSSTMANAIQTTASPPQTKLASHAHIYSTTKPVFASTRSSQTAWYMTKSSDLMQHQPNPSPVDFVRRDSTWKQTQHANEWSQTVKLPTVSLVDAFNAFRNISSMKINA